MNKGIKMATISKDVPGPGRANEDSIRTVTHGVASDRATITAQAAINANGIAVTLTVNRVVEVREAKFRVRLPSGKSN